MTTIPAPLLAPPPLAKTPLPERNGQHPTRTLSQAHETFRQWLGKEYDLDTLDVCLAAVAVERMDGDPLWVLVISGSGNAKTETVQAASGAGAHVVSSISSEAALLSATSKRDRSKAATGGLLREIGTHGVLVIKDMTTILTMNTNLRGPVLAALREIHDGSWVRKVGSDGGMTIPWAGRVAVIGAVTTAWDSAHAVVATMGDRFVLVRSDSTKGRLVSGRQALANTGSEVKMRAALSEAVAGVLAQMAEPPWPSLTEQESDRLLVDADVVTLMRSAVEFDYHGNVIEVHAPEMPTRFAKELGQIVRGMIALGSSREDALRLALRCARDSVSPARLAIVDFVHLHPGATTEDVRSGTRRPRTSVDRQLQALDALGVLERSGGGGGGLWTYRVAPDVQPLRALEQK